MEVNTLLDIELRFVEKRIPGLDHPARVLQQRRAYTRVRDDYDSPWQKVWSDWTDVPFVEPGDPA